MARITTNTSGTQPVIKVSLSSDMSSAITVPFVQDLTVTNSTGVYSYTTFNDADTRKLSTPADNEISTNIVVDDSTWFGTTGSSGTTAAAKGLLNLSSAKDLLYFEVYYAGDAAGARFTTGQGFITGLAPTTSPEAPVWVSPLTIAVDGGFTQDTVA
jgi:hypothetical protein